MASTDRVCLCKGITEETIVNSIKNGATSVEEVKTATGATTGGCCGGRCRGKIELLISENK